MVPWLWGTAAAWGAEIPLQQNTLPIGDLQRADHALAFGFERLGQLEWQRHLPRRHYLGLRPPVNLPRACEPCEAL